MLNITPHLNESIKDTHCLMMLDLKPHCLIWGGGMRKSNGEARTTWEEQQRNWGARQASDKWSHWPLVTHIIPQTKLTSWYPQEQVPFVAVRKAGLQQAIALLVTEALMCQIDKSWAYKPNLWAISERMPIHASSWVLEMVCFFSFSVHLLMGNFHLLLFAFKTTSFPLQPYRYSTEGVC